MIIESGTETLSLGCGYYKEPADGYGLFYDCPLTSLYLGRNLSYKTSNAYGNSPFCSIYTLVEVTIGNSVTEIGKYAFYDCEGLTDLYSLNPTPPILDTKKFANKQYMDMNVYVPQGSLSAYQGADVWKNFWNLQEIDSTTGVETIKADGKKGDNTYYDIQGRKLNAPKRGLNIINGKKVLIKK